MIKKQILFFACSLLLLVNRSSAQTRGKNAAAASDDLARLRAAVEANPNDLKAHEAYLKAAGFSRSGDPAVAKQYQAWMQQFPSSPVVPYALGHVYTNKKLAHGKPYFLKALQADPKFIPAYDDLITIAQLTGNDELLMEYVQKARQAAPGNPKYAVLYANSFKEKNFPKYRELTLQLMEDFPGQEAAFEALNSLRLSTKGNIREQIELFERIKEILLKKKELENGESAALFWYCDLMIEFAPEKALALAQTFSGLNHKEDRYKQGQLFDQYASTARGLMEANALLDKGKVAEASAILEQLSVVPGSSATEYLFLRKVKALAAAGKTVEAYNRVLTAYVKEPSALLYYHLSDLGRKLGKGADKVEQEVWYIRDTASRQAPYFTLLNYQTQKPVSLSDYKGKVVLLTYWFPGCGPCHAELPHFENVVKKFKDRADFAYVGINIVQNQGEYVLPLMKAKGYSFIPLEDAKEWNKGVIDNGRVAPVNFLIDQEGKVYYFKFKTDEKNEETLEIMIRSLLERKEKA
jgi:thiol-disulfide isomerase/thioredoxin